MSIDDTSEVTQIIMVAWQSNDPLVSTPFICSIVFYKL